MNQHRQTEAAGGVEAGAGGGGGTEGELMGKFEKPSEEKMELRPLSSTNEEAEGSGSQTADEQTASVQTPKAGRIFDWAKVNFGFLHVKIIKKMFGHLGVDFTTGKSGKNVFALIF